MQLTIAACVLFFDSTFTLHCYTFSDTMEFLSRKSRWNAVWLSETFNDFIWFLARLEWISVKVFQWSPRPRGFRSRSHLDTNIPRYAITRFAGSATKIDSRGDAFFILGVATKFLLDLSLSFFSIFGKNWGKKINASKKWILFSGFRLMKKWFNYTNWFSMFQKHWSSNEENGVHVEAMHEKMRPFQLLNKRTGLSWKNRGCFFVTIIFLKSVINYKMRNPRSLYLFSLGTRAQPLKSKSLGFVLENKVFKLQYARTEFRQHPRKLSWKLITRSKLNLRRFIVPMLSVIISESLKVPLTFSVQTKKSSLPAFCNRISLKNSLEIWMQALTHLPRSLISSYTISHSSSMG